jgi:hypothetical protein
MGNMETIKHPSIMNSRNMKKLNQMSSVLAVLLAAGALFVISSSANGVMLQGNPYVPAGADFQIFALQGIDSSNPTGHSGFSPQVNTDFEFTPSIGVSYDQGGGSLKDFGIGLYNNSSNQVGSTGLNIRYNQMVDAASVTITVEDFDLKSNKSTFFNPNKVEPSILLLGPNNTVIAHASPTDIFPNLTPNTTSGSKSSDIWNLNFGQLLNSLHLQDTSITGFILSADMANGEIPSSDPYLLVSAGSGIPAVPEAANYMAGVTAIAFAGLFHLRQFQLRRKKVKA